MTVEDEEYELIPLSPLRKMEKRLEKVEKAGTSQDMVRELIDVVKTNQQIVDDMVKINSDIINKIADLSTSVNNMVSKMDEFMSRIELEGVSVSDEKRMDDVTAIVSDKAPPEYDKRLDKMEKKINSLILTTMAKNRMLMPKPVPKRTGSPQM